MFLKISLSVENNNYIPIIFTLINKKISNIEQCLRKLVYDFKGLLTYTQKCYLT